VSDDAQDDPDFRGLCTAIGFVVLNWSIIEQQIDIWVNVALIDYAIEIPRNGVPRAFRSKVKFLRACFEKSPELRPFASDGLALIQRASALSEDRHKLVHGVLSAPEPEDGVYHFSKVTYERDGHSVRSFTFDPPAFSKLETDLGDLVTDSIEFGQKLAAPFPRWQQVPTK
jgi:hypothetical protein